MSKHDAHILGLLSGYLDEALPKKQRHEADAHLKTCESCAARWRELKNQRAALRTSPTVTPPDAFYQSVWNRIDDKAKRRELWNPLAWAMPTQALATACVLVVVVLVTREARQPGMVLPSDGMVNEVVPTIPAPAAVSSTVDALSAVGSNAPGTPAPATSRQASAKHVMAAITENRASQGLQEEAAPAAMPATPSIALSPSQADLSRTLAARPRPVAARQETVQKKLDTMSARIDKQLDKSVVDTSARDWKGSISGVNDARTVVIQNAVDWQTLWTEHVQPIQPAPPLPVIDFTRWTLVGIFAGTKPSGGYAVQITSETNDLSGVNVNYHESSPPSDAATAAVITQPYHLRLIPKTDQPVRFVLVPSSDGPVSPHLKTSAP